MMARRSVTGAEVVRAVSLRGVDVRIPYRSAPEREQIRQRVLRAGRLAGVVLSTRAVPKISHDGRRNAGVLIVTEWEQPAWARTAN